MMKAALFLLLFAAIAFPTCIDDASETVFSEQGINIGLVIVFTALIIAASYMIGNFLGDPKYIVFAKDEAWHLGFSLVMLVSFSGIVLFTCSTLGFFFDAIFPYLLADVGESECYSTGEGLDELSVCYVNIVQRDAQRMSESYIENYIGYLMDSTYAYTIQIPLFNSYTSTAGAYKRIISNQYDMIFNMFLMPALMSISMQKLALTFISENAIRWLIPAAFLLRIFTPTRQLGNILLALGVGLYIIVPFMFVFNLAMYEAVLNDCLAQAPNEKYYYEAVCDNAFDSNCDPPESTCSNPNSFWNVARLLPQAFFLPNLTIAVFITYLAAVNKAMKVIG